MADAGAFIVDDSAELTPAWLTGALAALPDSRVEQLQVERIGVGQGFASRLFRLTPRYAAGCDGPRSLILKVITDNPTLVRLFNPDIVFREPRFYHDVAAIGGLPVPRVYRIETDPVTQRFAVLMADLGTMPFGYEATAAESAAALRAIAGVHARYWRQPLLEEPWLQPLTRTELDLPTVFARAISIATQAGYGDSYMTRAMRILEPYVLDIAVDGPPPAIARSLTHGDFHRNNVLHEGGDRLVIFDWQLVEAGNPLRDVGYWLVTSLTVEQRRAQQEGLLRGYHRALRDAGVTGYGRWALSWDLRVGMFENLAKLYCIPALIQTDVAMLEMIRDRVEAAAWDIHLVPVAHFMRAVLLLKRALKSLRTRLPRAAAAPTK